MGGSAAALGVGVAAGHSLALGIGVLGVLVVSYIVILEPFVGVVILAALTPVTAALKRGLVVPHLRPSEALIVWLAPLVILSARRPVRPWGRLEWLGLAYAGGTLLLGGFDVWRRDAPFDSSNLDGMLGPLEYMALLRAVRVGVRTERQANVVVRALLLMSVPVCLFALLQGFGVSWAQHLSHVLTGVDDGHPSRATGPFTNWQVLAGYLLSVGLIAVSVAAFRAERIFTVAIAVALAVLIAAGLARTLTIGALAGFTVGSGALIVMGRRMRVDARRLLWFVGLGIVVLGVVLATRYQQEFVARPGQASNGIVPNTVMDRIHNWIQQYLPALSGRWVTGYGPQIPPDVTWKYTDSVYVTIILRGGLLLFALYAALMTGFVGVARSAKAAVPEAQAIATALLVLVLVLVPLQTIATYFTTSGLPEVTWILASLASILVARRTART